MTEVQKLENMLKRRDLILLDVLYGDMAHQASDDELARSIRASILSVQRGGGRDIDLSF